MSKTLRERFVEALLAAGEKQTFSKSGKFLTFTRKDGGYYFIGKSGSLRFGATSTNSIPVENKRKAQLLGIEGTI